MWDVKYDLMFNQDDLESNICLIFVKSLPPSRAVKLNNDITTPVQSASGLKPPPAFRLWGPPPHPDTGGIPDFHDVSSDK